MKVLATTDGSELSLKALGELSRFIKPEDNPIDLVSVYASPRTLTYGADPMNVSYERMADQLREAAESDCEAGRRVLAAQGFEVKTLTVMGEPAPAILTLAEQLTPDLIVVGSHGRSGFTRFLLGSVSERVLRYAPCSTLVIKLPRNPA
jgi:nucleotide-binding universal stress UspA family protein